MKKNTRKTLTAAMILGAIGLGALMASAATTTAGPGPVPFSAWDSDGNGTIDQQEFNAMRQQRQEAMQAGGRLGRNMAAAPTFAQIDTDGNGLITAGELTAMQQNRWHNRQAMGPHHGGGQGMTGAMGPRYQTMDPETRARHDAFLADTEEIRRAIAAKRAEKQALMRSTNPDPERAAQLTRELLNLRSQMMTKADEAGIAFGPGSGHGYGHGGRGRHGGGRW